MKRSRIAPLLVLILSVQSGCDNKDATTSGVDNGAPAGLPSECQDLMAALETFKSCDKIPKDQRDKIIDGYQKVVKAMLTSGDKKISDGCRSSIKGIEQLSKTSGC